jgi:hypothetical protein
MKIALRKSGIAEALCHSLSRSRDVADRICSIDFDELFENVVRKLPGGIVNLGRRVRTKKCNKKGDRQKPCAGSQPWSPGKSDCSRASKSSSRITTAARKISQSAISRQLSALSYNCEFREFALPR